MKKAALTLLMLATFSYLSCANIKDMGKIKDLTGNVYGKLTVESLSRIEIKNGCYWLCRCSCGNSTIVLSGRLSSGDTKSCGCYRYNKTHGEGSKTTEWRSWHHMLDRCYNPNSARYYSHGARGIYVCDRWRHSYETFLSDMGRAPSPKHSMDRKDNNGPYSPENCRWATPLEQANNKQYHRTLTVNGVTKNVTSWAREVGLKAATIYARMNKGWSSNEAIKPLRS